MSRDPSCAPRTFGGWICPDCGELNDRSAAYLCEGYECTRHREREEMRRAVIERIESLSPAERRARLAR